MKINDVQVLTGTLCRLIESKDDRIAELERKLSDESALRRHSDDEAERLAKDLETALAQRDLANEEHATTIRETQKNVDRFETERSVQVDGLRGQIVALNNELTASKTNLKRALEHASALERGNELLIAKAQEASLALVEAKKGEPVRGADLLILGLEDALAVMEHNGFERSGSIASMIIDRIKSIRG
jgi:chromosome segregation ATPase